MGYNPSTKNISVASDLARLSYPRKTLLKVMENKVDFPRIDSGSKVIAVMRLCRHIARLAGKKFTIRIFTSSTEEAKRSLRETERIDCAGMIGE